jgi:hypothetical protein
MAYFDHSFAHLRFHFLTSYLTSSTAGFHGSPYLTVSTMAHHCFVLILLICSLRLILTSPWLSAFITRFHFDSNTSRFLFSPRSAFDSPFVLFFTHYGFTTFILITMVCHYFRFTCSRGFTLCFMLDFPTIVHSLFILIYHGSMMVLFWFPQFLYGSLRFINSNAYRGFTPHSFAYSFWLTQRHHGSFWPTTCLFWLHSRLPPVHFRLTTFYFITINGSHLPIFDTAHYLLFFDHGFTTSWF